MIVDSPLLARRLSLVVLALAVSSQTGCVIYRGVEPPPDPTDLPVQTARCGSALATYQYEHEGTPISKPSESIRDSALKAASESGLVDKALGADAKRLTLEVVNNEHSNLGLAFVCGFTFFLVPCPYENEITVTGKIMDGSTVAASATETASLKTIMEFFLVFALPFNNYSAPKETVRALTRSVCAELARQR